MSTIRVTFIETLAIALTDYVMAIGRMAGSVNGEVDVKVKLATAKLSNANNYLRVSAIRSPSPAAGRAMEVSAYIGTSQYPFIRFIFNYGQSTSFFQGSRPGAITVDYINTLEVGVALMQDICNLLQRTYILAPLVPGLGGDAYFEPAALERWIDAHKAADLV